MRFVQRSLGKTLSELVCKSRPAPLRPAPAAKSGLGFFSGVHEAFFNTLGGSHCSRLKRRLLCSTKTRHLAFHKPHPCYGCSSSSLSMSRSASVSFSIEVLSPLLVYIGLLPSVPRHSLALLLPYES